MTDKFCNGTLKLLGYPYIYTNISRKSKINTTSTTLKLYEKKKWKKNYTTKLFLFGNSEIFKNFANFWPREAFSG